MPIVTDLPDARVVSLKQIYDWVANNTTTVPSGGDLIDKGWLPLIRAGIVTITSNGYIAWGLDASGTVQVIDDYSSAISNYTNMGQLVGMNLRPQISTTQMGSATPVINRIPVIGLVDFTSDAAGNLAADIELVAAKASNFGVIEWIGLFCKGNNGGTATLVIQGNAAILDMVSGTIVEKSLDTLNAGMIIKGDADNQNIFLDTTCSGLGNAQSYIAVFNYWYET